MLFGVMYLILWLACVYYIYDSIKEEMYGFVLIFLVLALVTGLQAVRYLVGW